MDATASRIVIVEGSPRKGGNCDTLAERLSDRLLTAGANVSTFTLRDLSYQGCINLFHCKGASDRCGQQDDLTAVLDAIRDCDALVIATPIYFTDVPSQVKAVIDRFFSFLVPDYPAADLKTRLKGPKSLSLIQVQGEAGDAYNDLLSRYEKGFRMLGFAPFHLVHASGVREIGDLDDRDDIMRAIVALAETLISEVTG